MRHYERPERDSQEPIVIDKGYASEAGGHKAALAVFVIPVLAGRRWGLGRLPTDPAY